MAFALDLVVGVAGLAVSLDRVRTNAQALGSLGSPDLDLERLRALRADAGRAGWFAGHPALRAAAVVVPDLATAASLARASEDLSGPAVALAESFSGGAGLFVDGRVDIDRLRAAGRHARTLHADAGNWSDRLAGASSPWSATLRAAVHDVTEELDGLVGPLGKLAATLDMLPSVLGADGPRTYLLSFQSPSEARGGGGLIGVVGELRAATGTLELGAIRSVRELVRRMHGRVSAPAGFARTYQPLLALTEWRNANVSPNFPITARIMLQMYRRSTGVEADGVLSTDPLAVGALTDVTGPIRADGWNVAITKDNVRRVLLHDVYRHFHFREHVQNVYFENLIDAFWSNLTSGEIDPVALAEPVARSIARQRLKLYLTDPTEQQTIARLGAEGAFHDEPGAQMVFTNNLAANKIDFFLHRAVTTRVRLREDGSAAVRTEVVLDNRIEELERNVIARPGVQRSLPLGLNRSSLSVLMPPGAGRISMLVDGRVLTPRVGTDAGHPVASTFVDVPARRTTRVLVVYRVPAAVVDGRFRLTLVPQATARPDRVTVEVDRADGTLIFEAEEVLKEPLRVDVPAT